MRGLVLTFAVTVAGCSSDSSAPLPNGISFPKGVSDVSLSTVDDIRGGPCSVSTDGYVWYALPGGPFPAIDFTKISCASPASLIANGSPPIPAWAQATHGTQAIFVATSLQEAYSPEGLQTIEGIASAAGVPMSWMIGNSLYLQNNADAYNAYHAANGDDVELEGQTGLYAAADASLPWFAPAIDVAGAGKYRNVAAAQTFGDGGFWGITWNSHPTDNTADKGAPWGTFCADVTSYKRPSPTGDCSLVSFEWTARDLTRAYLTNTDADGYTAEAAFSTDPDDVTLRGGFGTADGAQYVRRLVDAYASAGVTQPIVMMSQQESEDEANNAARDNPILSALYTEAIAAGMKPMTLRDALPLAKTFSAAPRAIAFPFIPGGRETSYNGVPFAPATIDYHDAIAGMTFIAGHTLPARLFTYAQDPVSTVGRPLIETDPTNPSYPRVTNVTLRNGTLYVSFVASTATHFGIALWSDPAKLALGGANVTVAGHAGAVVTFDLPPGTSTQQVVCGGCTPGAFAYSI